MDKKSILIVEDEEILALSLKMNLENAGYNVYGEVATGEDAVAKSGEYSPDLVLMDINLAGELDGIEAALEIRKRYNIPSVFLTAYLNQSTIKEAAKAAPLGYLTKPVDIRHLESTIVMAFSRLELENKSIENETRYRNLFEDSNEAIFIIDDDWKFIDFNKSILELLECSSSQLFDIDFVSFINEPEMFSGFKQLLDEKGVVKDYELLLKKKSGATFYSSVSANTIFSSSISKKIHQGIIRDLSEKESLIGQLNRTVDGIIQALVLTVEARDPYTAGHQLRVSKIATAIAKILGLTLDEVKATTISSKIHDLGKVYIPSEILSKPYGISNDEFQIIKTHSAVGYDILRTIEFPWPVADIVYQHHERIDGSGYPRGLSADEILKEAKIISVADVVEAMASDRPYRAAIGLDAALEEIKKGRGIVYDQDVADACMELFNNDNSIIEKSFSYSYSHVRSAGAPPLA